jgi:DNA-binding MarR family transcriptional regulator
MHENVIRELTERYIQCSHEVWKVGEALLREEIGEQLTTDQMYLLRYINKKQRVTSTELADFFCVQKSAVTAMINRLVEKGLIGREQHAADRRVVYLYLTPHGKELSQKLQEKVNKITNAFISKFDPEEIGSFIQTYEKLAKMLRQMR